VKSLVLATVLAMAGMFSATADTSFLDLTSVSAGPAGGFSGTLGYVAVTGSITSTSPGFQFNDPTGTNSWEESTIDNSSAQWGYSKVFNPNIGLADRVGYTSFKDGFNAATITINFSSSVVNPIFEFANLDAMVYDFSSNAGIKLIPLSSNAGGGDGFFVISNLIFDANPESGIGQDPSQQPFLTGERSAYGSAELMGTFSSLTINVSNPTERGDGGSFTLATTPEPSTFALLAVSLSILATGIRKRQHSTA
jgi:hypothetical protein